MSNDNTSASWLLPLAHLEETIAKRRGESAETSYVASLLKAEPEKTLKKVVEEAGELVMAAMRLSAIQDTQDTKGIESARTRLISEAADVQFHLQVALAYYNVGLSDVAHELQRRQGVSGHIEKSQRTS